MVDEGEANASFRDFNQKLQIYEKREMDIDEAKTMRASSFIMKRLLRFNSLVKRSSKNYYENLMKRKRKILAISV